LALPLIDGFRRLVEAGTRFDLGKHKKLTATRNNIDFAERAPPAPRQNSKSLRD
jgi:hypothetical protein